MVCIDKGKYWWGWAKDSLECCKTWPLQDICCKGQRDRQQIRAVYTLWDRMCVHRQAQKAMQVQGSRADTQVQVLEQPGHSMRRKVLGKAEQHRSEEIWMVSAQVEQVNHPFFFSTVSFHVPISLDILSFSTWEFAWDEISVVHMLIQNFHMPIRPFRYLDCWTSRNSGWVDCTLGRWTLQHSHTMSNESKNCQTCCAYAVQMICICTVCPACSEGVCSTLCSQNIYMVQVHVFLLEQQDKHRVYFTHSLSICRGGNIFSAGKKKRQDMKFLFV